jgi:hypothetical protein
MTALTPHLTKLPLELIQKIIYYLILLIPYNEPFPRFPNPSPAVTNFYYFFTNPDEMKTMETSFPFIKTNIVTMYQLKQQEKFNFERLQNLSTIDKPNRTLLLPISIIPRLKLLRSNNPPSYLETIPPPPPSNNGYIAINDYSHIQPDVFNSAFIPGDFLFP